MTDEGTKKKKRNKKKNESVITSSVVASRSEYVSVTAYRAPSFCTKVWGRERGTRSAYQQLCGGTKRFGQPSHKQKKKQQLRSSSEQKRTAMKRQERKKTKKECEKVVVEEKRGKKRDVPQRNGTQKESTVTATPWGADAWEPSVFANTQEGE